MRSEVGRLLFPEGCSCALSVPDYLCKLHGRPPEPEDGIELQMLADRARVEGLSLELFSTWVDGANLRLGCSPRLALREGRLEEVLGVLHAFAMGRSDL